MFNRILITLIILALFVGTVQAQQWTHPDPLPAHRNTLETRNDGRSYGSQDFYGGTQEQRARYQDYKAVNGETPTSRDYQQWLETDNLNTAVGSYHGHIQVERNQNGRVTDAYIPSRADVEATGITVHRGTYHQAQNQQSERVSNKPRIGGRGLERKGDYGSYQGSWQNEPDRTGSVSYYDFYDR